MSKILQIIYVMEEYKKLCKNETMMPLCIKKATLIDRSSGLLIKQIQVHLLQSNNVIVDFPAKPTSRVFNFKST